MAGTVNMFLYFAYGSNLLAQRIHINNPSAMRAGIAKLKVSKQHCTYNNSTILYLYSTLINFSFSMKDYRLDFVRYSRNWKGAAATIVQSSGDHVWGALWEINNDHMESLDR